METPTTSASSKTTEELYTLASLIEEIRNAKGWSLAELMRKHASNGLGSDKTFNKILRRDFSEMKIEDKAVSYRHVLNLLQDVGEEAAEEPVFSDLIGANAVRKGVTRAMISTTVARVGVIEGESGMGKTSCLQVIHHIYGKRIVQTEARGAWHDRPSALLGQILEDLGEQPGPRNAVIRQRAVERALRASRRCLVIEEAHHLGPRCLDVLKAIINQTKTEVIMAAIPTLLKRVEREAYEESLQLFRNRLAFRVVLRLHKADIEDLLRRRLPVPGLAPDDLPKAAELLKLNAPKHGNLALVREVCRALRETWAEEKLTRPVTLADLTAATQSEISARRPE